MICKYTPSSVGCLFRHVFLSIPICLFIYLLAMTGGILVPRPGIEAGTLAVRPQSPDHWTPREFSIFFLILLEEQKFFVLEKSSLFFLLLLIILVSYLKILCQILGYGELPFIFCEAFYSSSSYF